MQDPGHGAMRCFIAYVCAARNGAGGKADEYRELILS